MTAIDVSSNGVTPTEAPVLLEGRHLVQEFVVRGHGGVKDGVVHAVSDVSFEVRSGETLNKISRKHKTQNK